MNISVELTYDEIRGLALLRIKKFENIYRDVSETISFMNRKLTSTEDMLEIIQKEEDFKALPSLCKKGIEKIDVILENENVNKYIFSKNSDVANALNIIKHKVQFIQNVPENFVSSAYKNDILELMDLAICSFKKDFSK